MKDLTKTKNEKSISTDQGTFTIDMGGKEQEIKGEQLTKETGVNVFGVRYNGYNGEKYIQKVTYNKNEKFTIWIGFIYWIWSSCSI
jgi:hypothetical protein